MNRPATLTYLSFDSPVGPPPTGGSSPLAFGALVDVDVREEIVTTVVFAAPVAATEMSETPVAPSTKTHLTAGDGDWTWQQLRDYVVSAIADRFGNFPRNPIIEKAIFSGFINRWGSQAKDIAKCAVEVHGCWWRNAPISIQRFCQGSDPYFAQVIARQLG